HRGNQALIVDLDDVSHTGHVHADAAVGGEGAALRAGPAPARHDRDAVVRGDPNDVLHLAGRPWAHYEVSAGVREAPVVEVLRHPGPVARLGLPFVGIGADVLGAD